MLSLVELTNATMYSFNSTDSSFLDLLNMSSHAYNFEIPFKGFKSPVVANLVAVT